MCSLGSGSSGNATLIEAGDGAHTTRVLVDCGFSLRELTLRLARRGVDVRTIAAVFVTHEHGDHVGCARTLARRHGTTLWTSAGTWAALDDAASAASAVTSRTTRPPRCCAAVRTAGCATSSRRT